MGTVSRDCLDRSSPTFYQKIMKLLVVLTIISYVRAEADAQLAVALPRYAAPAPLPGYGVPVPRFGAPLIYSPNPTYKKTPKDFKKLIQTYSGLKDARGGCQPWQEQAIIDFFENNISIGCVNAFIDSVLEDNNCLSDYEY